MAPDTCCLAAIAESRALAVFIGMKAGQLAKKMFLAYLDGTITSATIAELVAEVQNHSTHFAIVDWVQSKVQEQVNLTGVFPNEVQLRDVCSNAIDTFTMASPAGQAADAPVSLAGRAYFSGSLQAVIGGINDIALSDSQIVRTDPTEMEFKGAYAIRDFYDFDNDRSMFPAYDKLRKDLTVLCLADCLLFMTSFHGAMAAAPNSGGDAKKGPLDKPQIFTCFMYALEMAGCTHSLFWEAEIPFTAKVQLTTPIDPPKPPEPPLPPVPKPPRPPRPKPIPPTPPPTPPRPPNPDDVIYVVKPGDNLSKIAKKFYGQETLWPKIYNANKQVIGPNPNLIFAGQRLVIPDAPK